MKTTTFGTKPEEKVTHKTVKMTIDDDGVEHLMSNLTNLYSNPSLAILREYSANALDSHIKAGQTKPIQITLPENSNDYTFQVKDFGVGLSEDELENIYSKYGSSTKRDSNKQIGAFGLGAKSALAITNRFDIVSVKDGIKNVVYIEKNNNGVGVLHFVGQSPTKESNGVTISIAVPAHASDFKVAAATFFDTWKPGTVLIDGFAPARSIYGKDFIRVNSAGHDTAWIKVYSDQAAARTWSRYNGMEELTFLVGGIAYPMPSDLLLKAPDLKSLGELGVQIGEVLKSNNKIYLDLPIGSVSLTPSREALMINEKTINAIRVATKEFLANIATYAESHIQSLERKEAYKFVVNNYALFRPDLNGKGKVIPVYGARNTRTVTPNTHIKWRGEVVPMFIELPINKTYLLATQAKGRGLSSASKVSELHVFKAAGKQTPVPYGNNGNVWAFGGSGVQSFLIKTTGELADKSDNMNLVTKNIRDYALATFNSTNNAFIVTNDESIDDKWIDGAFHIVELEELVKVARLYRTTKRSEAQTGTNRSKASYIVFKADRANKSLDKVLTSDLVGEDIVYIRQEDTYSPFASYSRYSVWNFAKDGITSDLPGNEVEKLNNLFPGASFIFLTKGKSEDALVKKYPDAINVKDLLSQKLTEYNSNDADRKFFAGVFSGVEDRIEHVVFASELIARDKRFNEITDPYSRSVLEEISAKGEAYSISSLIDDFGGMMIEDAQFIKVRKTKAKNVYFDFARKLKIIDNNFRFPQNRRSLAAYDSAFVSQLILFINTMDSASK